MFGFGKRDADSGAMYQAVIHMACAHFEIFNEMPTEAKLIGDVEAVLAKFNAKVKNSQRKDLNDAAFLIASGMGDFDEDIKRIGKTSNLTNENMEKIALKFQRHAIFFL